MKNKGLKVALVTGGLAVLAGVLIFGMNAAVGAPTYEPPGPGVAPTFTGLTVTGSAGVNGGLTVNTADVSDDVNVGGNMTVDGTVSGSDPYSSSIDVSGARVEVTGGMNVNGATTFLNSVTFGGTVNVNTLNPVTSLVLSKITNVSSPNNSALHLTSMGSGEDPTLTLDSVNHSATFAYLNQVTVSDANLVVTGNVQATKFGTYNRRFTSNSISAGALVSKSTVCNAGEYLVSCGYIAGAVDVLALYPSSNTCWSALKNTTAGSLTVTLYALCLDPMGL
ncbi:MAG: hypothetical protein ABIH78_00260 [Candidatus Peregrinibacteria bacterium]